MRAGSRAAVDRVRVASGRATAEAGRECLSIEPGGAGAHRPDCLTDQSVQRMDDPVAIPTRLTDALGVEHPVLLAGMGGVSYHRLECFPAGQAVPVGAT
jgi:hypothetical protein